MTWMQTYSGRKFEYDNPTPAMVSIVDIVQALPNLCRFTGQCRFFYSVAEHSVLVSRLVDPEFAYQALMHDAHEAYINDINTPFKRQLGAPFVAAEGPVIAAVHAALGLPIVLDESVHHADRVAAVSERDILMGVPPEAWEGYPEPNNYALAFIRGDEPELARRLFINRLREVNPTMFKEYERASAPH